MVINHFCIGHTPSIFIGFAWGILQCIQPRGEGGGYTYFSTCSLLHLHTLVPTNVGTKPTPLTMHVSIYSVGCLFLGICCFYTIAMVWLLLLGLWRILRGDSQSVIKQVRFIFIELSTTESYSPTWFTPEIQIVVGSLFPLNANVRTVRADLSFWKFRNT